MQLISNEPIDWLIDSCTVRNLVQSSVWTLGSIPVLQWSPVRQGSSAPLCSLPVHSLGTWPRLNIDRHKTDRLICLPQGPLKKDRITKEETAWSLGAEPEPVSLFHWLSPSELFNKTKTPQNESVHHFRCEGLKSHKNIGCSSRDGRKSELKIKDGCLVSFIWQNIWVLVEMCIIVGTSGTKDLLIWRKHLIGRNKNLKKFKFWWIVKKKKKNVFKLKIRS